ncbi:LPXTG cell wall anchor domain-containing protein [Actinomyces sp. B33]|uniref:LPXTG cell wall anchor domain-containing protein n=1 Tax=Actinomyces sp. B33 TaxID=2942131 RepID=UPI002340DB85|nr:LPXTG cell wall anchor domain-containing protein [Actinomyces sp. B33]
MKRTLVAGAVVTGLMVFGAIPAMAADPIDCADLTAEQAAELEYARLGIIDVPADLAHCVAPAAPAPSEVDTPTAKEGAASEAALADMREYIINEELAAAADAEAERNYLDAAEAEYNRLLKAGETKPETKPEVKPETKPEAKADAAKADAAKPAAGGLAKTGAASAIIAGAAALAAVSGGGIFAWSKRR